MYYETSKREKISVQQASFEEIEIQVNGGVHNICEEIEIRGVGVGSIPTAPENTSYEIQEPESTLHKIRMDRVLALAQPPSISTDTAAVLALNHDELQLKQREYGRSMLQLENAMIAPNQIEKKWGRDLSSNARID